MQQTIDPDGDHPRRVPHHVVTETSRQQAHVLQIERFGSQGDIRFDFELLCITSRIHRLGISAHGNRKSGNHYYNLLFEKLHITYFEIFNALSIT